MVSIGWSFAFLVWIVCAFACGWLAKEKHRSVPGHFVLGLLLGVIGVVITLCSRRFYFDERMQIWGTHRYHDKIWAGLSPDDRELLLSRDEDAPAAPRRDLDSPAAEVERLADLHQRGVLSDAEFATGKRKALGLDRRRMPRGSGPASY